MHIEAISTGQRGHDDVISTGQRGHDDVISTGQRGHNDVISTEHAVTSHLIWQDQQKCSDSVRVHDDVIKMTLSIENDIILCSCCNRVIPRMQSIHQSLDANRLLHKMRGSKKEEGRWYVSGP